MRWKISKGLLVFLAAVGADAAHAQSNKSPDYDLRLAISAQLLSDAVAKFHLLRYGHWYHGDPCRFDTEAYIFLNHPELSLEPARDAAGLPAAKINFHTAASADIRGCGNPSIDAQAWLSGVIGGFGQSLNGPPLITIPATGKAEYTIKFGSIHVDGRVDLSRSFSIPGSLLSIPVTLTDPAAGKLEFGTGTISSWTRAADPKTRAVPVSLRISSWGSVLAVDATVGPERLETYSTPNVADSAFQGDVPLLNGGNVGFTVRDTLFGSTAPGTSPKGLLSVLLPLKVTIPVKGKMLWVIPYDTELEAVFDHASIRPIQHDQGDAYEVGLKAGSARLDGANLVSKDGIVNDIVAKIVFDRIGVEASKLKFRIADFHIEVSAWKTVLPIRLSSGALEKSLNSGQFDLAMLGSLPIEMPVCIKTGPPFISEPAASCEGGGRGIYGYLGYNSGPRVVTFVPDLNSLVVKRAGSEVEGKRWGGTQASLKARAQ